MDGWGVCLEVDVGLGCAVLVVLCWRGGEKMKRRW